VPQPNPSGIGHLVSISVVGAGLAPARIVAAAPPGITGSFDMLVGNFVGVDRLEGRGPRVRLATSDQRGWRSEVRWASPEALPYGTLLRSLAGSRCIFRTLSPSSRSRRSRWSSDHIRSARSCRI